MQWMRVSDLCFGAKKATHSALYLSMGSHVFSFLSFSLFLFIYTIKRIALFSLCNIYLYMVLTFYLVFLLLSFVVVLSPRCATLRYFVVFFLCYINVNRNLKMSDLITISIQIKIPGILPEIFIATRIRNF